VNYQIGSWVLGLEGSGNWSMVRGTDTCAGGNTDSIYSGFNCGSQIAALATLTGRVGYAFDRSLLYVKGGAAWDRQKDQFNMVGVGLGLLTNNSTNRGWTIGVVSNTSCRRTGRWRWNTDITTSAGRLR